eukprot:gene4464-4711_t
MAEAPASLLDVYDNRTYQGRARKFFATCNPLLVFASTSRLDAARDMVMRLRNGDREAATKASKDEAGSAAEGVQPPWPSCGAAVLYGSAFHPDTGEKIFLPARMSFQAAAHPQPASHSGAHPAMMWRIRSTSPWGNMVILGTALAFCHSALALGLVQVVNQSFNALVTYCNRNATTGITNGQLALAFCTATNSGVAASTGLSRLFKKSATLSKQQAFIPLIAAAVATCFNVPLMRSQFYNAPEQQLLQASCFTESKFSGKIAKCVLDAHSCWFGDLFTCGKIGSTNLFPVLVGSIQ